MTEFLRNNLNRHRIIRMKTTSHTRNHTRRLEEMKKVMTRQSQVLGLNWDTVTDEFFFELSDLSRYGK